MKNYEKTWTWCRWRPACIDSKQRFASKFQSRNAPCLDKTPFYERKASHFLHVNCLFFYRNTDITGNRMQIMARLIFTASFWPTVQFRKTSLHFHQLQSTYYLRPRSSTLHVSQQYTGVFYNSILGSLRVSQALQMCINCRCNYMQFSWASL